MQYVKTTCAKGHCLWQEGGIIRINTWERMGWGAVNENKSYFHFASSKLTIALMREKVFVNWSINCKPHFSPNKPLKKESTLNFPFKLSGCNEVAFKNCHDSLSDITSGKRALIAPPPHLKLLLFLASFSYGQTEGSSYVLFVQQSREKGRTRNTKLRQQEAIRRENKGEEAVSSFFHCVVLSQCGIFPKCEARFFCRVVIMIELSNIFRICHCAKFSRNSGALFNAIFFG